MSDDLAIRRGYPPEAHMVVCVDYDGTLFPWGMLDGDPAPLPGAVAALRKLVARGYRIVILTSRMNRTWLDNNRYSSDEMRTLIEDSLTRHGIPFDDITGEKVPAMAYVDDLAIRYRDNWPEIADWLLFSGDESPA